MKMFARTVTARRLRSIPALLWLCHRLSVFAHPLQMLRYYLSRQAPPEGWIPLRNGKRIFLTGHRDDILTVFSVFVRREYGIVSIGDTVIDVGANLGGFSLFCAFSGASKVLSYEPCSRAYETLQRNVHENGLEGVIVPVKCAVTGAPTEFVRMSSGDGPRNRIMGNALTQTGETELVPTVCLQQIVHTYGLTKVDILKLDCEGAEYDILYHTPPNVLRIFRSIRMEFHNGLTDWLLRLTQDNGFRTSRLVWEDRKTGIVHFRQVR